MRWISTLISSFNRMNLQVKKSWGNHPGAVGLRVSVWTCPNKKWIFAACSEQRPSRERGQKNKGSRWSFFFFPSLNSEIKIQLKLVWGLTRKKILLMGTICGWEMPAAPCFPPSTQMLLCGVCSPPHPRYYSSHPGAAQSNPNYLRRLFSGWARCRKAAAAHYAYVT